MKRPDDEKPKPQLRLYAPKALSYERHAYHTVDDLQWQDMMEHASIDQKRAIRRRIAGQLKAGIGEFMEFWEANKRQVDTAIGHYTVTPLGRRKSQRAKCEAFKEKLAEIEAIASAESRRKPVDWKYREISEEGHPLPRLHRPEIAPVLENAWEKMADMAMLMRSIGCDPAVASLAIPLMNKIDLMDELNQHINKAEMDNTPPPKGRTGKNGRSGA